MEIRSSVVLVNANGLHARPCHAIASAALGFQSTLRVACEGREVDGKSVLQLMTLCAARGARLECVARGGDAQELISRLEELVRTGFGEES